MPDSYDVSPTPKQVQAVNAVIQGETNLGQAMRDAGYSETSSLNPKQNFMDSKGVKTYLETLDDKSKQKFNMSVIDKALEAYMDALEANKLVPVRATISGSQMEYKVAKIPDHHIRIQAADRVVKIYGADKKPPTPPQPTPDINSPEVKKFNEGLRKFLEGFDYNTD